jgi:hypothetical protein
MGVLEAIPAGSTVVIEADGEYVDLDAKEAIAAYKEDAQRKNVTVRLQGVDMAGAAAGGGH